MLTFFNSNFGHLLTEQTGHPAADAQRALSKGHAMRKGGGPQVYVGVLPQARWPRFNRPSRPSR